LLSTGQMSLMGQAANAVVARVTLRSSAVRKGFIGGYGLAIDARLTLKRVSAGFPKGIAILAHGSARHEPFGLAALRLRNPRE